MQLSILLQCYLHSSSQTILWSSRMAEMLCKAKGSMCGCRNVSAVLIDAEEHHLWRAGHLDYCSPKTLNRTSCSRPLFGWHSRTEHRNVSSGDPRLKDGYDFGDFHTCAIKTGMDVQRLFLCSWNAYTNRGSMLTLVPAVVRVHQLSSEPLNAAQYPPSR